MNEEKLQNLIDSIENDMKNPTSSFCITFSEVFEVLGYEDDIVCSNPDPSLVIIYVVLQQAQKTKQLEARIEKLEKLSHEHFDPSKFGPA